MGKIDWSVVWKKQMVWYKKAGEPGWRAQQNNIRKLVEEQLCSQ
jgi:hypothetical protein